MVQSFHTTVNLSLPVHREAWEATWGYATAEYRNASVALARAQNPGKSEVELEQLAAAAYTNASVELLALTARTSSRLRPKAKVGFCKCFLSIRCDCWY